QLAVEPAEQLLRASTRGVKGGEHLHRDSSRFMHMEPCARQVTATFNVFRNHPDHAAGLKRSLTRQSPSRELGRLFIDAHRLPPSNENQSGLVQRPHPHRSQPDPDVALDEGDVYWAGQVKVEEVVFDAHLYRPLTRVLATICAISVDQATSILLAHLESS